VNRQTRKISVRPNGSRVGRFFRWSAVLAYLSRYTHRVAVANSCLIACVTPTTTTNADGSTTIANAVDNADGSLAYERLLNTSANGL
jgi:hypothetical protein